MSSIQIPSNPLREHFSRSWMPFEKPLLLLTKVPPWFTSDLSKLALQFQKSVQPDLKPVQPVSGLFLCHLCPASLTVKSCQKSRVQRFFENRFNRIWARLNRFWVRSSLRLSSSMNRELPGGNRFNRFKNQFNRFLVHFSQRLSAFGGSFKYPHTLSLHSLLPFYDFLADQPPNKGIHFTSHTRNRIPFNRLKDPWCEVESI